MSDTEHAQTINYEDTWLLGGARTPFADYNGYAARCVRHGPRHQGGT